MQRIKMGIVATGILGPLTCLAVLEVVKPGIVLDDEQDLMWLQDVNYAVSSGQDADGLMTWNDAMAWVEGLDFAGYMDWRLPAMVEMNVWNSSSSEVSYLFTNYNISGHRYNDPTDYTGPFIDVPGKSGYYDAASFWTMDVDPDNPDSQVWLYVMQGPGAWANYYGFNDMDTFESHAWPVKDWTWGPLQVIEHGWVDTGDWIGWIWVRHFPYVYVQDAGTWVFVTEATENALEGWVFFPQS